jgi:hypothetical protein
MKTANLDSIVQMTPASNSATWWALFLLELGKNADYDLLLHYLTLAQENGCLHEIRLAAEKVVRSQASLKKLRGPVKARESGTTLKAVKVVKMVKAVA